MDAALLSLVAGAQVAMLAVQLGLLVLVAWRIRRDRLPNTPWLDVPAKAISGSLPCGGAYEVVAGLAEDDPVSPSGVVVFDVHSDTWRLFEVWARTDHGWVQLQPGPGAGAFRNTLVAGLRISSFRLWFAPVDRQPDESGLRAAAGLLVPAALLLTRARPTSELARSPGPIASPGVPPSGAGPEAAPDKRRTRTPAPSSDRPLATPARRTLGGSGEAHTPVD